MSLLTFNVLIIAYKTDVRMRKPSNHLCYLIENWVHILLSNNHSQMQCFKLSWYGKRFLTTIPTKLEALYMGKNNDTFTHQNNQHNNQNEQGEVNELQRKKLQYNQEHSNHDENEQVENAQNEQSLEDSKE